MSTIKPFKGTISQLRALNIKIGNNWFHKDTMSFFNCKIESSLLKGGYFITSERMTLDHNKLYTIRRGTIHGTVDTLGEFQKYHTKEEAKKALSQIRTKSHV